MTILAPQILKNGKKFLWKIGKVISFFLSIDMIDWFENAVDYVLIQILLYVNSETWVDFIPDFNLTALPIGMNDKCWREKSISTVCSVVKVRTINTPKAILNGK